MYNNLIEEDIMILDNEFFKIDTMFETVNKMYDIKMKELEYNYIYTESINEEYVDLYTEAEEAKSKNEQGLLGRLFTAILNFIRSIRAKILRLFGNDKKAAELEAKIKGNPKLANQTVEITNTSDSEKAIDEGTSFFGSLIDKIVKGTATEADADAAEEKNKSLLSRIAIFGGGALLAAGGAKVANDKLHITEKLGNLLKMEEDTKKKAAKVTQTNEQIVQKGEQALKNNSQTGNEENTKAGRRIMGSFKGFITDAGKFFTGKASELKSKINGVSSDEQQTSTSQERPKNTNTQQANDDTQQTEQKNLTPDEYYKKTIKSEKQKEFFKFKDENDKMIDEIQDYLVEISRETRLNGNDIITEYYIILKGSKRAKPNIPPSMTFEKIKTYNQKLKELLDKSKKEYEDLKSKNNTSEPSKTQKTNDKQQTLTSQERPKNTNTQQANDDTQQTEQKNLTPEEQKEFDKYKEENETLKQEIRGYINNKNNIKIAYFKQQKFYATEKKYNIKLKGQRHPEIKPSMTLEEIKEYNQKFKNHRDEIKESYEMRMKISEDENKEKTPNKVEKQPGTSTTDTTEQKNGKNDKTKPETKSDNQDHELSPEEKIDDEIKVLLNAFRAYTSSSKDGPVTLTLKEKHIDPGKSIVSPEDRSKINFSTGSSMSPKNTVEIAKRFLDSYSIFSKYKNPDKNKVKEVLKNICGDDYEDDFLDEEMNDIKKTFTALDKYAKELNELIKKRETFKESSYDLINDILTIFENSF